jgi:LytS/YehU family sensor histidine kinase
MVFIPFIENAYKHAKNKKIENAITVVITINDETIQLICENKFDAKSKLQYEIGGLGNDLIKKRLQLIYAENHTLEVHKTEELYSINLIIPHG